MKKLLTEERLRELAGLQEADTESLYKTRLDKAKRARHAAEKDFFGSDRDPLVTTDVPSTEAPDPNATQELTPDQVAQIQQDVPEEARRPVAMELYKSLVEPKYTEDELEMLVAQHEDVADALAQLIGWFHPAFEDSRGKPTYDNPSRLGIKVAQEFAAEGLDPVEKAQEFIARVEKYLHAEARQQFAANKASRRPAQNVKPGQSSIPGTAANKALQKLFKQIDAQDKFGSATTGKIQK
jgi:hypothetical protein